RALAAPCAEAQPVGHAPPRPVLVELACCLLAHVTSPREKRAHGQPNAIPEGYAAAAARPLSSSPGRGRWRSARPLFSMTDVVVAREQATCPGRCPRLAGASTSDRTARRARWPRPTLRLPSVGSARRQPPADRNEAAGAA